jgi:putative endonuclease
VTTSRRTLGDLGESAAAGYLRRLGWEILGRKHRSPAGEIDIVARDRESIVFVEVRTRAGDSFGTPEESITAAKAERMLRCAMLYISAHPDLTTDWRIDVVAVRVGPDRALSVRHYRNAVES